MDRRTLLAATAGATAALWVAPAVTSLDRVAAATGTCSTTDGLDWGDLGLGTPPASFPSTNGTTTIGYTMSDPNSVGTGNNGRVISSINGVSRPLEMRMVNAFGTAGVTVTLTFSTPVRPEFTVLDVDRNNPDFEDSIEVTGSNGGSPVAAPTITPGSANMVAAPGVVRGTANSTSSTSEALIVFTAPITTLTINYFTIYSIDKVQKVGVGDMVWCA